MKNLLVFLISLTSCSGCYPQEKNAAYFLLHPQELQIVYDKCTTVEEKIDKTEAQECVAVFEVLPLFREYLTELIINPKLYGLHILENQSRWGQLKNQLQSLENQSEIKKVQAAMAREEMLIQSRIAILRFARQKR